MHVTLASFARHTKEVSENIAARKVFCLNEAEEAVRAAHFMQNRHDPIIASHPGLLLKEHPNAPRASVLAWEMLRLRFLLGCHEGKEALGRNASGIRGHVFHGPPSCVVCMLLRLCAPRANEPGRLTGDW